MVKKLSLSQFRTIYANVPRLCVDLCIKDKKGILLTLRQIEPFKGYWHFPGGTVLKGESLKDTAKRVAQEELGVRIKPEKFLGIIEWGQSKYYKGGVFTIVFLSKIIAGEIKTDFQAKEAGFFQKLPANTIAQHRQFLKDLALI